MNRRQMEEDEEREVPQTGDRKSQQEQEEEIQLVTYFGEYRITRQQD